MIASTQTIYSETFAFMAVQVFKFLRRKVVRINRKEVLKSRLLFTKLVNFTGKLLLNYE